MKRAIGSIFCILAILQIVSLLIAPKPDTIAHRIQDFAAIGVLLTIGIALSSAKKKKADDLGKTPSNVLLVQGEPARMETSLPSTQPPSFFQSMAKGSWVSSVLVFLLLLFSARSTARLVVELTALLIMVVGLVLAIIALSGMRQQGRKGILAPALVGLCINGLLVFVFVTNFLAASARAHQSQTTAASLVVPPDQRTVGTQPQGVSQRLCEHITTTRRKMFVDRNKAEIIWSDGAMLEVGASFSSDLQTLISQASYNQDIRSFVQRLDAGSNSGWKEASVTPSVRGDRYTTIKSADGKISTLVEPLYVEYLHQRYPSASIRIRSQLDPIIFVVGGKIRASVMPMKP